LIARVSSVASFIGSPTRTGHRNQFQNVTVFYTSFSTIL
jgi:hypothetical protein